MEIYSTEEEQEEAIKRFLKENGTSLILGAVIGLGGIYGWNYYQKAQIETIAQESLAFSQVTEQIAKPAALLADGEKFGAAHGDSQYSQLTQLIMVKALVDDQKFDKASTILNQVINSNVEQSVKSIAILRLARIETMQKKFDPALATLAKLSDSAFAVQKSELQGDLYLASGDITKARAAYQSAIDASGERVNADLKMKFNDLTPAA